MFLGNVADKFGLFDFLAPRRPKKNSAGSSADASDSTSSNASGKPAENTTPSKDVRQRRLQAQLEAEESANKLGAFAKNQRVSYYHKASDFSYDAVVIGVHFDDGPDKPYYVSMFTCKDHFNSVSTDPSKKLSSMRIIHLLSLCITFSHIGKSATKDNQIQQIYR